MALTPEQKAEAHQRGLRRKAEREAKEAAQKPKAAQKSGDKEYERFRKVGLNHEEALAEIEKRRNQKDMSLELFLKYPPTLDGGIYTGPRGGRYRINSNGRKSYDVP